MSGKEIFFVNEMYLEKSNYNLCLGDDLYAGSYQDRITIGPIQFDEQTGKAKFSKKSITIPSSEYVKLINAVDKADKSFEDVKSEPWESLVYMYTKVHHLMARYEIWEDEPTFKFIIKWNFVNDNGWNHLVIDGVKQLIDTSQLLDKQWLQMKRGAYLKKRHVDVLNSQMPILLEHSFNQSPKEKRMVRNLIDHILADEKLRVYVAERLENFDNLNFQSKMKIIRHLVDDMFKNESSEDEDGPPRKKSKKNDFSPSSSSYLEILSNKVMLIFSLFAYHLKQQKLQQW